MDFGNKYKFFKWWYVNVPDYKKLLGEKTASLIAMTIDEEVVRETVPLSVEEDGLAVADCGPNKGKFYLTPNQMVSREDAVKRFWLVDKTMHTNTNDILGIYTSMEANRAVMLPEGMRLFGKPEHGFATATVRTFQVNAIFPIENGKYIAWEKDKNICTIIGDRETNETEIKVLMEAMG